MKKIILISFTFFIHLDGLSQLIEPFSLPNTTDGTMYSLSDQMHNKAVVLIFYSGKCAYGDYYLERILNLRDEFSGLKVQFLLINANSSDFVPVESIEAMKTFAARHNLDMPYLADKDKKVKNILNATRTPEVFLLKPVQGKFEVVYQGAIDDNPQSASDVSHAYLAESIRSLLKNNRIAMNQTRPVGCLIK
jgi:peroxiredoxin